MKDYKKDILGPTEELPPLNELMPPVCPAPMPAQTILFWTPRSAIAATLRAMELQRLPPRPQPAAIAMTMPKPNEPR